MNTLKNIYITLQIKLFFNWTRALVLLYIVNLFIYNPTLCTETVTECRIIYRQLHYHDAGVYVEVWLKDQGPTQHYTYGPANVQHDPTALQRNPAKQSLPMAQSSSPIITEPLHNPAKSSLQSNPETLVLVPTAPALSTSTIPLKEQAYSTIPTRVYWRTEEHLIASLQERFRKITIPPIVSIPVEDRIYEVAQDLLKQAEQSVRIAAIKLNVSPDKVPDNVLRSIIYDVIRQHQDTPSWVCHTTKQFQNPLSSYKSLISVLDTLLKTEKSPSATIIAHVEACVIIFNKLTIANKSSVYSTLIQSSLYNTILEKLKSIED